MFSQIPNPRYNFKQLNVQNGLAQNIAYHFLQDSRGYIWIGTRNGLTLFDGINAVNFFHDEQNKNSLASNYITRIIQDPSRRLWVGTDLGLSLYNGSTNNFTNFSVLTIDKIKQNTYCVPLGFVSPYELWLIEPHTKSLRSFNTKSGISDVILSTTAVDGNLWYDSISRQRHIWTYLSTGTIHYVFTEKGLIKTENFFSEPKNTREKQFQVVHVFQKSDSVVWLSTTAGLVELHANTGNFILHNNFKGQLVNECRFAALAPNDSVLWVATGNNGIYTFNTNTKQYTDHFKNYQLDQASIASNNMVSLYFDDSGNIWCGSYGYGVSYTNVENNFFQKHLSRIELEKQGGNNNVFWTGFDNDKNLWCLFSEVSGFWKLNSEKRILEHKLPVLENGKKYPGPFNKLLFDGPHVWCINNEGLFKYEIATNRIRKMTYFNFSKDLFGSNWVGDIIRLDDQSIAFATFGGLYRITYKNGNYDIQPFSDLNTEKFISFTDLFQDENGTIYVKTLGDNLYVLKKIKQASGYNYVKSHAIPFLPKITQFQIDTASNRLLLATSDGLFHLDRKDYSVKKIQLDKRIPFVSLSGIIKSSDKIWLFGEKGIFYLDQKSNTSRIFTIEDGLPSNEFNPSTIMLSPSGECIAGTTNGLVSFYTDKLTGKNYPPLVRLTKIYINDALTDYVPNPGEADAIKLSHEQNTFSFEFSPIAYQHSAESSFEYKLEGFDEDWIKSGDKQLTRYSKIPPGNYTFLLRVMDANGNISPYTKKLDIQISKAFWHTNFFKIAVLAILASFFWLILRWEFNRKIRKHQRDFEKQQAVEKERTRIATDMHDDLGAGLSQIKFLSETIGIKKQKDQPIEEDIIKIRQHSHNMIYKMGEIVWALNEKNDSLTDLLSYTRSYAVEYLQQNGIICEMNVPKDVSGVFVSGEFRRNIYLTIKEALHNIVKHARASKVNFSIKAGSELNISIHDDGIGINENNIRPFSNGISNMQKRISSLKGRISIKKNNGTSVILSVPLEH